MTRNNLIKEIAGPLLVIAGTFFGSDSLYSGYIQRTLILPFSTEEQYQKLLEENRMRIANSAINIPLIKFNVSE